MTLWTDAEPPRQHDMTQLLYSTAAFFLGKVQIFKGARPPPAARTCAASRAGMHCKRRVRVISPPPSPPSVQPWAAASVCALRLRRPARRSRCCSSASP